MIIGISVVELWIFIISMKQKLSFQAQKMNNDFLTFKQPFWYLCDMEIKYPH